MKRLACRLLTVLVLVVGCDAGLDRPKDPAWGKQPCEQCAMLLSDKAHGAQLVADNGERMYFDDLGCMAGWTLANPGRPPRHQWVLVAATGEWVAAGAASFRTGERTPMGYGFVAVREGGSARWPDVVEAVRRKHEEER